MDETDDKPSRADQAFPDWLSTGLLSDWQIERLVEQFDTIQPFDPALLSGCSYDLRIGREVRSRNRGRTFDLSKGDFNFESGECISFKTIEQVDFKKQHLFALIVNRHSVLAKGILHPITKIDPGFSGPLAITLFNHGNKGETLTLGQPIVSLVIMVPSSYPTKIYGENQRPSYNEGSLDIAVIGNEPEKPLDDDGLSKMYGTAVSRLYKRVEEMEKRFEVGVIKKRLAGSEKRWDLFWRIALILLAGVVGAVLKEYWSVMIAAIHHLF